MIALVAIATIVAAGCLPRLQPAPDSSGYVCPAGIWSLDAHDVTKSISTPYGSVSLTLTSSGNTTLEITGGTWQFSGTETFAVSGSSLAGPISGTLEIAFDASGGYTVVDGDTIQFTVSSLSGTATFTGTVGGVPVTRTWSIDGSGLDVIYELVGTVQYGCNADGTLSLHFSGFRLGLR